jgi:predicted DNA-binding WGR domain protein
MSDRLLRHHYLEYTGGSSSKCYLVALVRSDDGSHRVDAAYGRIGGTLSSTSKAAGVDLRKAVAAYEATLAEKVRKGYREPVADGLINAVIDWFAARGATPSDLWSDLAGLALEPEETLFSLPTGTVATYTFKRRVVPRDGSGSANGRVWVTIDREGNALVIDPESGRRIHRTALARFGSLAALEPLLPLVLTGSRGATSLSDVISSRSAFTVLAEDVARVAGRDTTELPWSERRIILEQILAVLDAIEPNAVVYARETRDALATQVSELIAGEQVDEQIAIPLARRLDAAWGEPGGRLLIATPIG